MGMKHLEEICRPIEYKPVLSLPGTIQVNSKDWPLFYEGQVPSLCLILIDGQACIQRKNKIKILAGPMIIGLDQVIKKRPTLYTVIIKSGSKVLFFPRKEAESLRIEMDSLGLINQA